MGDAMSDLYDRRPTPEDVIKGLRDQIEGFRVAVQERREGSAGQIAKQLIDLYEAVDRDACQNTVCRDSGVTLIDGTPAICPDCHGMGKSARRVTFEAFAITSAIQIAEALIA